MMDRERIAKHNESDAKAADPIAEYAVKAQESDGSSMFDEAAQSDDEAQQVEGSRFAEWPGEVETFDIVGDDAMTIEQRQRVEALYVAGACLERKGPMGAVTPASIPDLVRLANWIIDGEAGL